MTQEVKMHENNKGFEWSMPDGPYEFLNPEQIKSFDENGYTVIEDAFNPEEIEKVLEKIDPFEFNVTEALKGLDGGKFFISRAEEITFTTHLVTQSEELKESSKNPLTN